MISKILRNNFYKYMIRIPIWDKTQNTIIKKTTNNIQLPIANCYLIILQISATCFPRNFAIDNSVSEGCLEPSPPAIVPAPKGEPVKFSRENNLTLCKIIVISNYMYGIGIELSYYFNNFTFIFK